MMTDFEMKGNYTSLQLIQKWLKWDAEQMIKYGESPNAVADYIESL